MSKTSQDVSETRIKLVMDLTTFASSHPLTTPWLSLAMRTAPLQLTPWVCVKEVSASFVHSLESLCPQYISPLIPSVFLVSQDCDEDADCQTGLSCIQRDADEDVSGCVGFGGTGWDYCAVPSVGGGGALVFIGDFEMDFYQLQECQGDCDFDSDCALGLICDFRDSGDGGVVPGCDGDAEDIASGSEDFCIQRPSATHLVILADDDAPEGFPLPVCAGDCDDDDDCQDGLVCLQRDFEEPVAGCEGLGEEGYDYCVPA